MSSSLPDGFDLRCATDAAAVAEGGERSVGLGIDSENPTGATRPHERAGMHVEDETVTFERSLA
jgi:hypothetical protein